MTSLTLILTTLSNWDGAHLAQDNQHHSSDPRLHQPLGTFLSDSPSSSWQSSVGWRNALKAQKCSSSWTIFTVLSVPREWDLTWWTYQGEKRRAAKRKPANWSPMEEYDESQENLQGDVMKHMSRWDKVPVRTKQHIGELRNYRSDIPVPVVH